MASQITPLYRLTLFFLQLSNIEIESSNKISTDSGANVCVVMNSSVKSSEMKGSVAQGDAPLLSSSAKPLAKEGEGDDEKAKVIANLMDNSKLIANSMANPKVKPPSSAKNKGHFLHQLQQLGLFQQPPFSIIQVMHACKSS